MGLIERAIEDAASGVPPANVDKIVSLAEARWIDADFDRLRAMGVFTSAAREEAQAFELRAIKRRLLRRVGFLQRAGRDRRQLQAGGCHRNLILFTSTRPGEGKSFSAVNLAVSLALEERLPVFLIDGDPARPRLRTYFNLPPEKGLTDLLKDPSVPLSAVSIKLKGLPLTFIGEGSPAPNTTDLFGSLEAKRFFASLSALCPDGLILIDAPPLLATTEAIALARHADEVVFVIEADSTPQPAIAGALDELLELNPNVSLLLNRCLVPAGGSHYAAYEYYEKNAGETGDAPSAAPERG
jgi:Mrp family chromosome partitioning ATPase